MPAKEQFKKKKYRAIVSRTPCPWISYKAQCSSLDYYVNLDHVLEDHKHSLLRQIQHDVFRTLVTHVEEFLTSKINFWQIKIERNLTS